MKRIVIIFVCLFLLGITVGQSIPQKYYDLVKVADSLYKAKDYKKSARTYSSAFEVIGWKGLQNDRYNAACAWALSNVPDSAECVKNWQMKWDIEQYKKDLPNLKNTYKK